MPGVKWTNVLTVRHTILNMCSHYPGYIRRPNLLEMKLRRLSEGAEGDLIEDPNWIMRVTSIPFRIPIDYQGAKTCFKREIDEIRKSVV